MHRNLKQSTKTWKKSTFAVLELKRQWLFVRARTNERFVYSTIDSCQPRSRERDKVINKVLICIRYVLRIATLN